MERETKEITTPSGHVVALKAYITGREEREYRKIYFSKIDDVGEDSKPKISGDLLIDMQNAAWNLVVVSINGKKAGDSMGEGEPAFSIVDAILDMQNTDTEFIRKAVDEITSPKKN